MLVANVRDLAYSFRLAIDIRGCLSEGYNDHIEEGFLKSDLLLILDSVCETSVNRHN